MGRGADVGGALRGPQAIANTGSSPAPSTSERSQLQAHPPYQAHRCYHDKHNIIIILHNHTIDSYSHCPQFTREEH